MNDILKHLTAENIISGVLSIVMGILFILIPNSFANILVIICGILLIIGGISFAAAFFTGNADKLRHPLAGAIILIILGIFCLTNIDMIKGVLNTFFGIIIICFGSIFLARSIESLIERSDGWLAPLILSAVTVVLGIIVLFGRFETIFVFTGIVLIISGIFTIVMSIMFSKQTKKAIRKRTPVDADWHETE